MARSIGEALATGLESGFGLATSYANQQAERARRERLDAQAQEDRARLLKRQDDADALSALTEQEKALSLEGAGYAAGETPPPAAVQQDFTGRVKGLQQAKGSILARRSGYDPETVRKQASADIDALNSGDLAALKPGQLIRATTAATGRNPADFIRADGKPALIEQAGADLMEGIKTGDNNRTLSGLNVLFAPQLQKGLGTEGAHGGKIIAKRIVSVIPDPNSPPDDPRVIPTLRVYVTNGKKEESGDEARARQAMDPNAPPGATGYYDAPLTQNRSSHPDDPVKSISMAEALDHVGKNLSLVEALNRPEALQKLQEDAGSGWDPQQYLQALASVGARAPEKKVTQTVVPAGASVLTTTTDKAGRVTQTVTQGNPKAMLRAKTIYEVAQEQADKNGTTLAEEIKALRPAGRPTLFQEAQDYAEENDIPVEKALAIMQAGGITKSPAAGRGAGLNSAANSVQSRSVDADGYVVLHMRDGSSQRATIDGKPIKSGDYSKRVDKIAADLAKGIDGIGKRPEELRAQAERLLSRGDAAPAPAAPAASSPGLNSGTKITPAQQRALDADAPRILRDELETERAKAANAKDPAVKRAAEQAVIALEKEIERAGGGKPSATPAAKPAGLNVLKFDKNGNRIN